MFATVTTVSLVRQNVVLVFVKIDFFLETDGGQSDFGKTNQEGFYGIKCVLDEFNGAFALILGFG